MNATEAFGEVLSETLVSGEKSSEKGEVDTSAPFRSVKEAVDLFGGSAVWKAQLSQLFLPCKPLSVEEFVVIDVEEQTAQLEKDLSVKERETLDVVKALESTKRVVDAIKSQFKQKAFEAVTVPETSLFGTFKDHSIFQSERGGTLCVDAGNAVIDTKPSSDSLFKELQQAKLDMCRATSELTKICAFIKSFCIQLKDEETLLEKTRQKINVNRAILSLVEHLEQMSSIRLMEIEGNEVDTKENDQLKSAEDQLRRIAAFVKSGALKLILEIEQMQDGINKVSEIRSPSARNMEASILENHTSVMLSNKEFAMLTCKAQGADDSSRKEIEASMLEVERSNLSNQELLVKVEEAAEEVKNTRKVLEDVLNHLDASNNGGLAVNGFLLRCSTEHKSNKLKDADQVLGLKFTGDAPMSGIKHAMSIGEILSRKLMGYHECDISIQGRRCKRATFSLGQILNRRATFSLGQILNRRSRVLSPSCIQQRRKRKKLGFTGLSLLLKQEVKKNKKEETNYGPGVVLPK